jgi:signal transduction histidine kinase
LDTIEGAWQIIQHNLDRTYLLTTNMLTFSKDRKPAIEMGQLNHVVEEAIRMYQRRADEKGVMLLADLADDLPAVPLDLEGMTQVAANVICNAIDAAPEGSGRIVVKTSYDGTDGRVYLSVSDNGPGIPPDEIDHVFHAFHSTKGHGGTGLGLAAARKIVHELGGDIEVESVQNESTVFHIYLPIDSVKLADSEETHGPVRV